MKLNEEITITVKPVERDLFVDYFATLNETYSLVGQGHSAETAVMALWVVCKNLYDKSVVMLKEDPSNSYWNERKDYLDRIGDF